ncbi:MAG: c-type cytochrome [Saprospiraceae bacterium]
MKKFLKVTAWVLGLLVLFIAGTAAYVNFAPAPTYDPPTIPDMQVEVTPERVEKGQKLASMLCVACHADNEGKLTGKHMADVPAAFGKIYSMNITMHPEKGIGKWTDGELYTFLRTGLRKDGSFSGIMPKFIHMADEDIYSIIAWLHSNDPKLEPSTKEPPRHALTLMSKGLLQFVFRPFELPTKPIPLPDTTDQIAWGKYLANATFDCYGCHSADFTKNNPLEPEKSAGFYAGGNPMLNMEGETIPSANLTPDEETGIGKWSQAQFLQALKYGQKPDGTTLRYPMQPHTALTDNEVNAIYAYLRTVPPIKNEVKTVHASH